MTNILILLIFNSLFIFGVYKLTWYQAQVMVNEPTKELFTLVPTVTNRELLWFISFYGKKWFGYETMKPICLCPSCMSSVWGSIFFWVAIFTKFVICATVLQIGFLYIAYVIALCGLNHIISRYV